MPCVSDERDIALERLEHMVEAADAIADYVARGRLAYDSDAAVRDAILFRIIVIGEAAKAVVQRDPTLARDLSEVEWSALAKMRDRVTHQYWAVDDQIVWDTAVEDIPELRAVLAGALRRLG
jgi:uncharacterized protein with HEPN domain